MSLLTELKLDISRNIIEEEYCDGLCDIFDTKIKSLTKLDLIM